ncbi:beige protein [Ceratobasidium sp. AG-Ba]|nr:beige protein [Ceratobasidium sp. AG-Ba]
MAEQAKTTGVVEGPETGTAREDAHSKGDEDEDEDDKDDEDEDDDDEEELKKASEDEDYEEYSDDETELDDEDDYLNDDLEGSGCCGGEPECRGGEDVSGGNVRGAEMPEPGELAEGRNQASRGATDVPQLRNSTHCVCDGHQTSDPHQFVETREQTNSQHSTVHGAPQDQTPLGFPTTLTTIHLIPKRPTFKCYNVGDVARRLGFSKFFKHIREHPYFSSLPVSIHPSTLLNVWKTIRIRTPGSTVSPNDHTFRIYSHSGLDETGTVLPRWDPVFYLPTTSPVVFWDPKSEVIGDYSVGRVALLFAIRSSAEVPEPRVMVYIERFSDIPKTPTGTTGLHAVRRLLESNREQRRLEDGGQRSRFEVVAVSQLARICPLSPLFKGPATTGIEGHESLNHYNTFYINKY